MSPSFPTPAFLHILNIFLPPTLPKFPFFHNCHATPKGHGLPPPKILNVHQTGREVFESTLEEALGSVDFSGLLSTSDLDTYADFIVAAISTAVDKAIPKAKKRGI